MYYFLNTRIDINKSGIEHAQIKRMNLFNDYNIENKIVTCSLALSVTDVLKSSKIPHKNYLNMYDFFRQEKSHSKPLLLEDFELSDGMRFEKQKDEYSIIKNNKKHAILMTKSSQDLRIDNVRLLSKDGKLIKRSLYDDRGFIGVEEYFDKNNRLTLKKVLNSSGRVICNIFYMTNKQNVFNPTLYQLVNYKGQDFEFNSETDLMTFFFDELAKIDKKPVYVIDRASECSRSIFNMKTDVFKIFVLHNSHVSDNDNVLTSPPNPNYYYPLNHLNKWNAILTSTKTQTNDFNERYKEYINVFTVPVAYIKPNIEKVSFESRTPYKIGLIARLSEQKQQLQAVTAMAKVKVQFPQAKLYLYGYSNGNYGERVKELVKQLHLENEIVFQNYTDNIESVYKTLQLQLLTSSVEGFGMVTLEGLSHGVPQIAYDVRYGPSDIITNGEDGYLISSNDTEKLSDTIINYFNNFYKMKKMSAKAYENSQKYSKNSVYLSWEKVFKKVEMFYSKNKGVIE